MKSNGTRGGREERGEGVMTEGGRGATSFPRPYQSCIIVC